MGEKKSFFRERATNEIREVLHIKEVYNQKNLVKKILDLDPFAEGLELRVQIIPGKWCLGVSNHDEASRKCYKHGDLITLSQPLTQKDAYECRDIPLTVRKRDFEKLEKMKEEEINYIGYSFQPVQGRDRRKRVVPFVWVLEAARLYAYAENMAGGTDIIPYADARKVKIEGANIICKVPSRTRKKRRYEIKLMHVPVEGVTERRAVAWGLKSNFRIEPEHNQWNIRYTWEYDREGSDRFTFYPHDMAAYYAVIAHYLKQHNLTPMEMSPLTVPSKKEAEDFYKKLCNNIIIYDPTLSRKEKFRKLHLAEKCIMIGRSIPVLGHDESMFWEPSRDGRLKDYDWRI